MPTKKILSLQKAFKILSAFSKAEPELGAEEISKFIRVPKSSVYRYLNTLVHESILEYDFSSKKYRLGFRILELASLVYDRLELRKIAAPFIKEFSEKTQETVYLTVLNRDRAVCIEKIESNFALRLSVNRGESFPLHSCATSRILMAHLPEEQQESIISGGLDKYTQNTMTDPAELREELAKIKKQGFAYSDQELDEGARAVSAPIFDCFGRVIAGLSIAGPVYRFTDEKREEYEHLVKQYAKQVSLKLGFVA